MTDARTDDEALDWFVKLAARPDPAIEAEFQRWLTASPDHQDAYNRLTSFWEMLGSAQALDEALDLHGSAVPSAGAYPLIRRRQMRTTFPGQRSMIAGLAAAACVGLWFFGAALLQPPQPGPASFVLASEESALQGHRFEDGSVITLGPESRVEVRFTGESRMAVLESGIAYFEVAKDASRPFTVKAGQNTVLVRGTAFDVQLGADSLRVAVNHGAVEINVMGHDTQHLRGGEQFVVTSNGIERSTVAPGSVASWIGGRLIYRQAPLRIIAEDLDRYMSGRAVTVSREAGNLRMTATFDTNRAEEALEAIALANGLELSFDSIGNAELSMPAKH